MRKFGNMNTFLKIVKILIPYKQIISQIFRQIFTQRDSQFIRHIHTQNDSFFIN